MCGVTKSTGSVTRVRATYRGAELGALPVRFIGAPHVKVRLQRAFTHRQRTGETIDADARICGLCANRHASGTARCQEQTVEEWLDEDERRVKLLATAVQEQCGDFMLTRRTTLAVRDWSAVGRTEAPETAPVGEWWHRVRRSCKGRRLAALRARAAEQAEQDDSALRDALRVLFSRTTSHHTT